MPPDRFPPRLAELGYQVAFLNGAEVILPPLCDVPTGPFLMGSDTRTGPQSNDRELPQQSVTLAAFQIAKYPVTVAEYACFVRATNHAEPESQYNQSMWAWQLSERLDHPLVNVTWYDALAYAKWLAQLTGEPWRLPSEAEWEKTARGTDGRIYPWGDVFETSRANTIEGGKQATTPVGSYPSGASPYGALDMAGNVWEWTNSILKPYPYVAGDGRERADSTEDRVLRGGSWTNNAGNARAACRADGEPGLLDDIYGFRLALAAPTS
jgi:formylglycine-generating enzyme required for sulfatase activity